MARKRKANHEAVVAAGLELFWNVGYAGANTREIEEKTGLTRFTLQTVYGGKEKFFLETLDAYLDRAEAQHFPDIDRFGLPELADWFENLTTPERIPGIEQTGCLAFNSIGDFDRENSEVNARIKRYLEALRFRFEQIVHKARNDDILEGTVNPDEASRLLLNSLLGLHVMIKARSNDEEPRAYAKAIANMIRGWRR